MKRALLVEGQKRTLVRGTPWIIYKPNSIHEHIDLTISISLKQVIYY